MGEALTDSEVCCGNWSVPLENPRNAVIEIDEIIATVLHEPL